MATEIVSGGLERTWINCRERQRRRRGRRNEESAGVHHRGMLSSTSHFTGKMPVEPALSEKSSNVARAQHEGLRGAVAGGAANGM
jgi:hypothetical protein